MASKDLTMLDEAWRRFESEYDGAQRDFINKLNKAVEKLKISVADATEQIQQIEIIKQESTEKGAAVRREALTALKANLENCVRNNNDEANNVVTKVWGEKRVAPLGQKLKNHVDLVELLGNVDTKRGFNVGDLIHDSANNVVTKVWGEKRVAPLGQKLKNHVELVELLGVKIAGARRILWFDKPRRHQCELDFIKLNKEVEEGKISRADANEQIMKSTEKGIREALAAMRASSENWVRNKNDKSNEEN